MCMCKLLHRKDLSIESVQLGKLERNALCLEIEPWLRNLFRLFTSFGTLVADRKRCFSHRILYVPWNCWVWSDAVSYPMFRTRLSFMPSVSEQDLTFPIRPTPTISTPMYLSYVMFFRNECLPRFSWLNDSPVIMCLDSMSHGPRLPVNFMLIYDFFNQNVSESIIKSN